MKQQKLKKGLSEQKIGIMSIVLIIYGVLISTISVSQNIAINETGSAANGTSILDVQPDVSLNKGLLIPRLTTAQQSAISSPAQSLLIYNTTDSCFEAYIGTVWIKFGCAAGCTFPAVPTAGTNTPSQTQIVWNWNASTGATTYYYNTVNNFNTAISNGASTSYTQTSLTCNTAYTLYVWASNGCGRSNPVTLTQTTSCCLSCGAQCWAAANMNVGVGNTVTQATTQAAGQQWCYNDVAANCTTYGGLFQWASAMNLASTQNSVLHYGANLPSCDPCGAGGIQGICPAGYHIPTDLEWSRYEYCLESTLAPTGAYTIANFQTVVGWRGTNTAGVGPGSKMKTATGNPWGDGAWSTNTSGFAALPAGYSFGGTPSSIGTLAEYWSATEYNAASAWGRYLGTGIAQSYRNGYTKADGFSVRCIQN